MAIVIIRMVGKRFVRPHPISVSASVSDAQILEGRLSAVDFLPSL
jgi:hypothetical protein